MFINLVRDRKFSSEFAAHNFEVYWGELHQVPDPGFDIELALRDARGWPPTPTLIPTLSFTLTRQCCRCFLNQHPGTPIRERDYYLSKLYQFFSTALFDEGCQAAEILSAASRLEEILDPVCPDGQPLPPFDSLDWVRIFADYADDKERDLEAVIADLPAYLKPGQAYTSQRPSETRNAIPLPDSAKYRRNGDESVGEFIDRCRGEETVEQLACRAGFNPTQVYRVKKKDRVRGDTLQSLAGALCCRVDDLL